VAANLTPADVVPLPSPFTTRAVQRRRPALVLSDPDVQRGTARLLRALITAAGRFRWPGQPLCQSAGA
jgi:hypothetical protein